MLISEKEDKAAHEWNAQSWIYRATLAEDPGRASTQSVGAPWLSLILHCVMFDAMTRLAMKTKAMPRADVSFRHHERHASSAQKRCGVTHRVELGVADTLDCAFCPAIAAGRCQRDEMYIPPEPMATRLRSQVVASLIGVQPCR